MRSKRKFFRQVILVEVLSEDKPLAWNDLGDVNYAITDGDRSGKVEEISCGEVSAEDMARLLASQHSDPSFFGLTDDGEDADE